MPAENTTVVRVLNQLIASCKDCENDFREGAELVQDTRLQLRLRHCEQLYAELAAELQAEERAYSLQPSESGTLTGALHRGWMSVRHALGRRSDDRVLRACLQRTESTRKLYQEALNVPFPPRLAALLAHHLSAINRASQVLTPFDDAVLR
jgi:uncharacterized protein (TIGR02284 family)